MTAAPPTERLSLRVDAPAARLAARLRAYLLARGWVLAERGERALDGFELTLRAVERAVVWVLPSPPEAVPGELGAVLSQELGARVTTVLEAGEVCAYEVHERGRLVEKLATRGAEVLEDSGGPFGAQVGAGAALPALLMEAGLSAPDVGVGRDITLVFRPRVQAAAEAIEIDPLVTCPVCGAPTRLASGRFGPFYACVRYPECRGKRTVAEAKRLRDR